MTIFFTSDTHFGEARILRAAKRPVVSIAEHDEVLKRGWKQKTVGEDDEIWHLGDVGVAPGADGMTELLEKLHGRKHLIIGNNRAGRRRSRAPPGRASSTIRNYG